MGALTAGLGHDQPDAAALIDDRGVTTWAQLDARVNRVGAVLKAEGVGPGDVVVAMLGNQREFFELSLACMENGLLLVPLNWHWVADEVQYVLDDSGAKAFVVDQRFAHVAEQVRFDGLCLTVADAESSWERSLAAATAAPGEPVRGGVMFYTSGTTGRPKGVRGGLAVVGGDPAMWQLMAGMADLFDLPPRDAVFLLCGPAYHSAQWVFSVFCLLRSATVVMQHKFDAADVLRLVDEHRVTNLHLVPTQFTRLLRLDPETRAAHDLSSLVAVHHGAAPCPAPTKRAMIDWLGPIVSEYYGGTEGGFISMISAADWLERPGSVGRPLPIMTVTVVDDDGNELPAGQIGQLWFASALGTDFEYHNAPEKTRDAHRSPGVGTLGDVGYLDEDGFLYLSDRKIDMIISGGVNIYPAEIEAVLTRDPAVECAAVFGVPDDEFGEAVHAVIEAPAAPADLVDRLTALCRSSLAGYKCPRTFAVVDELPRSEAGKVLKRQLREPYWSSAALA
jgi:long-chain acyl-CoA synthetase